LWSLCMKGVYLSAKPDRRGMGGRHTQTPSPLAQTKATSDSRTDPKPPSSYRPPEAQNTTFDNSFLRKATLDIALPQ